jgi:hypothetical protein
MMSREAMQMALEALELYQSRMSVQMFDEAVKALRQALETKQEPVAWRVHPFDYGIGHEGAYAMTMRPEQRDAWKRKGWNVEPLYTAPPKHEWVGLTADEIWKCNKAKSGSAVEFHICYAHQNVLDFAEAIEAKLREKNKW